MHNPNIFRGNPEAFEINHNPEERGSLPRALRALRIRAAALFVVAATSLPSSDVSPAPTFEVRFAGDGGPKPKLPTGTERFPYTPKNLGK